MGLASSSDKERKSGKRYFDDRYEITAIAGRGSRSVVYAANRRVIAGSGAAGDSKVAIKVLLGDANSPAIKERLRTEGLIVRSCEHPGVVRLFDFRASDGFCYLLFEYAELGDLTTFTKHTGGRLEPESAQTFLRQGLEALQAIHERKILHRDIKPANLLVTDANTLKIADFGVAALPGDTATGSDIIAAIATINYCSPEILQDLPCSPQSDLYSLALSIYEATTGVYPFGADPANLGLRMSAVIIPPIQLIPQVTREFSDTILALLSPSPEQRPRTAAEGLAILAGDIRPKITGESTVTLPSSTPADTISEVTAAPLTTATPLGTGSAQRKRVLNTEELPESTTEFVVDSANKVVESEGATSGKTVSAHDLTSTASRGEGASASETLLEGGKREVNLSPEELDAARSDTAFIPSSVLESIRNEVGGIAPSDTSNPATAAQASSHSSSNRSSFDQPSQFLREEESAPSGHSPKDKMLGQRDGVEQYGTDQHDAVQVRADAGHHQESENLQDHADADIANGYNRLSDPSSDQYGDDQEALSSEDFEDESYITDDDSQDEGYGSQEYDDEEYYNQEHSSDESEEDDGLNGWLSRRGRRNDAPIESEEDDEDRANFMTHTRARQNRVLKTLLILGLTLPILYSIIPTSLESLTSLLPSQVGSLLGLDSTQTVPAAESKGTDSAASEIGSSGKIGDATSEAAGAPSAIVPNSSGAKEAKSPETSQAADTSGGVATSATAANILPRYTGEALTFPALPQGVFKGTINNISGRDKAELTFISFPDRKQVVVAIGIEGWTPKTVELANAKDDLKVPLNGHILRFTLDKGANKSFLKGPVYDLTTGGKGRWEVSPVK